MIASFKSKPLAVFWATGSSAKIDARFHARIRRRLDALNQAAKADALNLPGFDFHPLHGFTPVRYSVHVNGPWCITFEFVGVDAHNVDWEQYH